MPVGISAGLSPLLSGTEKRNYLPSHLVRQHDTTKVRSLLQCQRLKAPLQLSGLPPQPGRKAGNSAKWLRFRQGLNLGSAS